MGDECVLPSPTYNVLGHPEQIHMVFASKGQSRALTKASESLTHWQFGVLRNRKREQFEFAEIDMGETFILRLLYFVVQEDEFIPLRQAQGYDNLRRTHLSFIIFPSKAFFQYLENIDCCQADFGSGTKNTYTTIVIKKIEIALGNYTTGNY